MDRNDNAVRVLKDLRSRTDKPVEAVIYNHHHADHINGAAAFVSNRKDIKIIATENFMSKVAAETQATGQHCQTKAALCQKPYELAISGRQLTPLGQGGETVLFEVPAVVKMTFLVEMIMDRGVDGGEFL